MFAHKDLTFFEYESLLFNPKTASYFFLEPDEIVADFCEGFTGFRFTFCWTLIGGNAVEYSPVEVEVEGVIGGVVFGDLNRDRKLLFDFCEDGVIDVVISDKLGDKDTDTDRLRLLLLYIVYRYYIGTVEEKEEKKGGTIAGNTN